MCDRRTCPFGRHDEYAAAGVFQLNSPVGPAHERIADNPRSLAIPLFKVSEKTGRQRKARSGVEDDWCRLVVLPTVK